jgi:hypothetical protein
VFFNDCSACKALYLQEFTRANLQISGKQSSMTVAEKSLQFTDIKKYAQTILKRYSFIKLKGYAELSIVLKEESFLKKKK